MMRPDTKVEKVYLYPKPVDFRKSIDGLAALVELDIKVAVFDPDIAGQIANGWRNTGFHCGQHVLPRNRVRRVHEKPQLSAG